ncbi:MAG: hypothetical protein M3169_07060 [Candidatus Eremiobacteraeota bacterium]|nr:hypothetical protein [Candidatus Eremiobacteraeota bacterium]
MIFHAVPDFATTNVQLPSSDIGFAAIVAVKVTCATTYALDPVTSINGLGATVPLNPLSFACAANALNAAAQRTHVSGPDHEYGANSSMIAVDGAHAARSAAVACPPASGRNSQLALKVVECE